METKQGLSIVHGTLAFFLSCQSKHDLLDTCNELMHSLLQEEKIMTKLSCVYIAATTTIRKNDQTKIIKISKLYKEWEETKQC